MSDRRRIVGINPISKQTSKTNFMKNVMPRQRPSRYENFQKGSKIRRNDSAVPSSSESYQTRPLYKSIATQVIGILKEGPRIPLSEEKRKACIDLLGGCANTEPAVTHIDNQGYDILQYVVGKKDIHLLNYIFQRDFDAAINKRKCSSLLNIACSTGKPRLVSHLLDLGCQVNHKSSTCFPQVKHYVLNPRSPDAVCDYHHVGCCRQEKKDLVTPLHVAIQYDDLFLVKILLSHESTELEPLSKGILEYACSKNAIKCLPFLIQTFSQDVNYVDSLGKNLIQHSFKSSEECGMVFMSEATKHGLDDGIINNRSEIINNGTMLHYIFWQEHGIRFLDIVNKMMDAGYRPSNLGLTDSLGNTLLHLLMLQVGKRIKPSVITSELLKFPNSSPDDYETVLRKLEKEKEEHIFATMKFLIDHDVPKDAICYNGEGIIHKLLHNCVYLNLSSFSMFTKVLPQIINILEYLLRCGLDLSISAEYCSTPLNYVVHTISSFSAQELDTIWPNIWYLFSIFLKYGADPNTTDRRGVSNVSILLTTLHRWLNVCLTPAENDLIDKDLPIRTLIRMQDLFSLFLQHGLKPKQEILELCCKQVAILCNIKSNELLFIEEVKNIFKPFFLHGINPNTLRMITEGNESYGVPCQLHAQFYLARSFIIHNDTDSMFHFMKIFSNTLEQDKFNSLLTSLCTILQDNFNNSDVDTSRICVKQITKLKHTVRPLKSLARISVANTLCWKIEGRKAFLPLPKILQDYLAQL